MSRLRECVEQSAAELHAVAPPGELGRDLDLGLRMVEGLVRIGEVGSAIRLAEELRLEAAEVLTPPPPARSRRTPRGATVIAGVAVALGVGLSAAAFVGTNSGHDAIERPAQIERHTEPASSAPEILPPVLGADGSAPLEADGSSAPSSHVAPAAEDEVDEPGDGRRRVPRIDPPDEFPYPSEPPPLPLIIPLPDLPVG